MVSKTSDTPLGTMRIPNGNYSRDDGLVDTTSVSNTQTSNTTPLENGTNNTTSIHSNGGGIKPPQVPVAVVGMGCRLPGHCNSPTELWEFLRNGGVADTRPPSSRFRLQGHHDAHRRPRTMKSPGGMFIEDVDPAAFDGAFFNLSRADCVAMDPQQRQLLEVTYECLENAGVPLETISGKAIGCLVGTNIIDYASLQNRDPEDRPTSATIGVASSILANRISHFLNIHGPSLMVDSACSSSLVAVDVACRYLDSGQVDGMVVGGANMWFAPEHNEETGMMRMTQSASGRCHSFDAKADGYVKAEGINVVYLKRLDDALRDGDPVRAVIRGTAANSTGRGHGADAGTGMGMGIASPNADAQAACIRAAYAKAGITPSEFGATGFLECHGTGTLAGDPVEVQGVAAVFAATREPGLGRELVIGSIKSNIGHSEGAAGLSGLIKAVLTVEHGVIPGNPTFLEPNPNIDFAGARVCVSRFVIRWPGGSSKVVVKGGSAAASPGILRRAGVNSFGFGGANAHAIVENLNAPVGYARHVSSYKNTAAEDFFDGDDDDAYDENDTIQEPTVLVFSANDEPSLRHQIKSLSDHFFNPGVSVDTKDLAYTLSERRSRHYVRAFSISRTAKAHEIPEDSLVFGKKASLSPRVGFVFTGQGAQWSQMGKDLVDLFPLARKTIEELDGVLQTEENPPPWSLLAELTEPRSSERLRQPEFSQPLVTALQLALLAVLRDWGIRPSAVVGHSSGEIAAAAAVGLITADEAIKIAYCRGQAAKKTSASASEALGMLSVGVGADVIEAYLAMVAAEDLEKHKVRIACYNSPKSLTMSGPTLILEKLRMRLRDDGHFARMLLVDLAYHHPHYLATTGDVYEKMLLDHVSHDHDKDNGKKSAAPLATTGGITKKENKERITMFSTVTGKRVAEGTVRLDASYWKRNMVSPVLFAQATSEMVRDPRGAGAEFLVEIGPSNALSGPIEQIKKSLGGAALHVPYTSAMKRQASPDSDLSILPLFSTAGRLFLSGGAVDLAQVNRLHHHHRQPSVIVDLPNYAWNHSKPQHRYWYETQASRDWRFKPFIHHDLLGSKLLGTAWQAPVFKKTLRLADLPWLRDHKLGARVVMPGAAYVTMAVEAMYQTAMMTAWKQQQQQHRGHRGSERDLEPDRYRFRLRDVRFSRALVLEEDVDTRYTLALTPAARGGGGGGGNAQPAWYEFRVCSTTGPEPDRADDPDNDEEEGAQTRQGLYTEHSTGLVCVEIEGLDYTDPRPAPPGATAPLDLPTPAAAWYKAMAETGYNAGPAFRKHLMVETTLGRRQTRSTVSLVPPESAYGQSRYPLHPAVLDGAFHTGFPPVWSGDLDPPAGSTLLVPQGISSLIILVRRVGRGFPSVRNDNSMEVDGKLEELKDEIELDLIQGDEDEYDQDEDKDEYGRSKEAIALASARYLGTGDRKDARNYGVDCHMYDPADGSLLLEIKGLTAGAIEANEEEKPRHSFTRLAWDADVRMLMLQQRLGSSGGVALQQFLPGEPADSPRVIQRLLDLVAHVNPTLRVLEWALSPDDDSSLWIQEDDSGKEDVGNRHNPLHGHSLRAGCSQYHFSVGDAGTLARVQSQYAAQAPSSAQFSILELSDDDGNKTKPHGVVSPDGLFDLAIVKLATNTDGGSLSKDKTQWEMLSSRLGSIVREGGFILGVGVDDHLWNMNGMVELANIGHDIYFAQKVSSNWSTSSISGGSSEDTGAANAVDHPAVRVVSFLDDSTLRLSRSAAQVLAEVEDELNNVRRASGRISFHRSSNLDELFTLGKDRLLEPILVLDELTDNIMEHITSEQWAALQYLIRQEDCRILWVTSGAQPLEPVKSPARAAIHGLFRSVRAEEGNRVRLLTLDVELPAGDATARAIAACLQVLLSEPTPSGGDDRANIPEDSEFVERGGVVLVSRIVRDPELTAQQSDERADRETVLVDDLHAHEATMQLGAERLGNPDSLTYAELTPFESSAPVVSSEGNGTADGDWVEVEIFAAGLNYKDVVVTMGIVPGDEKMLGGEAAGVVSRVGPGTSGSGFRVGDRVVAFAGGCFANRVRTTTARLHRIPDAMTFEEAATLCAVYLTVIYSLLDMADLTAGKRVLIHSAAGGVGIAAVQLARCVGAEIFATVGTPEKRAFLKATFGLSDDRIFNSRNTDFAHQILEATGGRGVDVVLNSLTGKLLDASFRILADGGAMVEIGKKDILNRGSLPMEPFDRNISFRAVDMSHERASDQLISRLLSKLFGLVENGHLKPINPIHVFSFAEVPSAIRFLRAGKHIGKIVISDGPNAKLKVPVQVRRAPQTLQLRSDACYLIVGGLKGLCGSLAIHLARRGAKYLAVVCRSGYEDDGSRRICKQVGAFGSHIDLLTCDITIPDQVEKAFQQTRGPICGIIQGAMVLQDRPFDTMTIDEFHAATSSKVQGTWNLHHASEKLGLRLDFFTLLSSISGVAGTRGQANYAAANAFLDAFAAYRRGRGQPACAVDLGVVEDAGFLADHGGFRERHLDERVYRGINDRLLRKIMDLSILQQQQQQQQQHQKQHDTNGEPGSRALGPVFSSSQIITGIAVPQPPDSALRQDARFAALFTAVPGSSSNNTYPNTSGGNTTDADAQALLSVLRSAAADPAAQLAAAVEVVGRGFARILRLAEPMDPGRPLAVYGIDSLAAVEVRNWVRAELGALVTTLDVMNSASLTAFCEKVVAKVVARTQVG